MTVRPPRTPPPGASRQPPRGYWRGRGRQCARPPTPRSGASAERAGQPDMFHRSTVPAARVIRTLTLGLLAITLPLSARGLYGPQGAWVHVRWQPSVDATERQRLETAWQFVDGQEVSLSTGVVARIVTGPHGAHPQNAYLSMRYDTGRPRAVIRFKISQPRTASLPCPAGLRARRPSPMMDL